MLCTPLTQVISSSLILAIVRFQTSSNVSQPTGTETKERKKILTTLPARYSENRMLVAKFEKRDVRLTYKQTEMCRREVTLRNCLKSTEVNQQ